MDPTVSDRERTIADFGEQWTRFPANEGYYASLGLFSDMVEPLVRPDEFSGCTVADIGSGTGRIVNMLHLVGARRILAVEPSAAMAELRRNTREYAEKIEYLPVGGEGLPSDLGLDWVVSIGVLHHVPDPAPIAAAAHAALRPGGRILVWLYGREGNRIYLAFVLPLRKLTRRLPHRVLHALSRLLEIPLSLYAGLSRRFPLPLAGYMRNLISRFSRPARVLVIYDQLNPQYAKYYTRTEAEDLLRSAGFTEVRSHHRHGYSWTVVGSKRSV